MKVCVYFQPKNKKEYFEGFRLRKNIKGALEIVDIPYAKDIIDSYDVMHFLSLSDELKINDAKEMGIPTVFSALNCESDDSASILTEKKDGYALSLKAIRTLNQVDVVLVSDQASKDLLIENGITTRIEIVTPGVNLSRFEFTSNLEEDIFYNYYQLEKQQKFVVIIGKYDDANKRKALYEIARLCPMYRFYYFGNARLTKLARIQYSVPNNLRLCPLANNEIYCSMMKKASIYLALDNSKHSPITLLDAAASKSQIVALAPTLLNEELLNDLHAYVGNNTKEVSEIINRLYTGDLKSTVDKAHVYAQKNSLMELGKRLKQIYESVLDRRDI
jgi:1,2-diacylglycerol-3-alpha-glucose alpha-1,2-glucosyltransferase